MWPHLCLAFSFYIAWIVPIIRPHLCYLRDVYEKSLTCVNASFERTEIHLFLICYIGSAEIWNDLRGWQLLRAVNAKRIAVFTEYFFLKSTQRIINGTVKESESLRAIDFATKIVKCSSLQAWDIGCLFFVFARSLRSFIMSRSHSDTMLFVRFTVRRYWWGNFRLDLANTERKVPIWFHITAARAGDADISPSYQFNYCCHGSVVHGKGQ